jgi:hypothetical protein
MTDEEYEGEAVEVEPVKAVAVPERLAGALTPEETVALAARMARALVDIVNQRRLYAVINGRKYPTVEAWMVVARMDGVVARERSATRQEDGSYEAEVDLIRLSDGAVVGHGSGICGMADDHNGKTDWSKRASQAKRGMAITRAASRAFRLQYSWIIQLAGYEPTPAEEMPDPESVEPRDTPRARLTATLAARRGVAPSSDSPSEPDVPAVVLPPADAGPQQDDEGTDRPDDGICRSVMPPPLGDGETCILEAEHSGPHQDEEGSRWPNK